MSEVRAVERLVLESRHRRLTHLVFEQAAWASCMALAAFIVLLITGAQVLSWYWPPLLALAALGFGLWRLRDCLPSPYRVAQELDHRLGLRDLLSTAFHFRDQPPSDFTAIVASEAERQASGVRPEAAFPWRRPRAFWPMVGMLLAVVGLMGIRYGRLQTLALNAPLVSFEFDPFAALFGQKQQVAKKLPVTPLQSAPLDPATPGDAFAELMAENKLISLDDPEQKGAALANQAGDRRSADTGEAEEAAAEEGDDPTQGKPGPPNSTKDVSQKGNDGQSGQPQNGKDQPKNSLLDKMRDAMTSLMEKMNIPPPGQDKQGQKNGDPSQKGSQMAKGQQAKGEKQGESESEKSSETSEGQGQKSEQGSASPDESNQPKTGMGRADGRKDIELAQQQEAMGKLSEILGKRSADLRAEVTVEVTNTKQTLRTPYLNRNAAHGESGGEIHRDEIPLHRQEYIQRYYDAVRRPAPAKR